MTRQPKTQYWQPVSATVDGRVYNGQYCLEDGWITVRSSYGPNKQARMLEGPPGRYPDQSSFVELLLAEIVKESKEK